MPDAGRGARDRPRRPQANLIRPAIRVEADLRWGPAFTVGPFL
jgi:hypothetical protein